MQHIQGLPKQIMVQNIFLVIIFFNYLSSTLNVHLEVFELIAFLFSIWVIKRWGAVFYHSKALAWQHPTTYGSFVVTSILGGMALLGLFNLQGLNLQFSYIILVILLAFDLLIVFARFQYLSKTGIGTNQVARDLMGSQILYFGSRIIIGIFMPAIFILYNLLIKEGDIIGVELLILVGILIDRFLFINTVKKF
jgi:DMSO reductase anchor subunit